MANNNRSSNRLAAEDKKPDQVVALKSQETGEALSMALEAMEGAFPSSELTVTDTMTDQDHVAIHIAVHASRSGNQRVSAEGILIYRIAEGRIAEHWLQPGMPDPVQELGSAPIWA